MQGGCVGIVTNANNLDAVVAATKQAAQAMFSVFVKCTNSDGSVVYNNQSENISRHRLVQADALRIFVNVSNVLPANADASAVQQSIQKLNASITSSVATGAFTSILRNVSAYYNSTATKSAAASEVSSSVTVEVLYQDPLTSAPSETPTIERMNAF